jgi:hypothetical protein
VSDHGAKIIPFPVRRRAVANLHDVLTLATAGRVDEAAQLLAGILGVDEPVAKRAASHYVRCLAAQPELADKAQRLRRELEDSATNNALVLLMDCFGLTIGEAVHAYGNLRQSLP